MGFDEHAFLKERFAPRVYEVPVPGLRDWFAERDDPNFEPVWKVRNLSGNEIGRIKQSADLAKSLQGVTDVLGDRAATAEAIKEMLGLDDDMPATVRRYLDIFVAGSYEPTASLEVAIRIKDHRPIEFEAIVKKILLATGEGSIAGKLQGSGGTQPSEPA